MPGFKKQFKKFFGLTDKNRQSTKTRSFSRWRELETFNQTELARKLSINMGPAAGKSPDRHRKESFL